MKKMIVVAIVLAAVACGFMGCGKPIQISAQALAGTYVAQFSHGTETLTLSPNGHYTQSYVGKGSGTNETSSGTWHLRMEPRPFVGLDDALLHDNKWNQPQIPRIRTGLALNIKVWKGGMIELVINDEEGLGYRKQEQRER